MALSYYQWHVAGAEMAKVLIVGMGVSGQSVARYLYGQEIAFAIADQNAEQEDAQALQDAYEDTEIILGDFAGLDFTLYETIILSPGVPRSLPQIQQAIDAGVEVIGDIELFARVVNAPVIAVTGSNGKSTVVHLLSEMADAANVNAALGGNFGNPALDLISDPEPDVYILELSSFQLESTISLKPRAATVLNISEDHLDRYDTFQDYVSAKEQIYKQANIQITNRDDVLAKNLATDRPTVSFGMDKPQRNDYGLTQIDGKEWLAKGDEALLPVSALKMTGRHNIANALAALALGDAIGLSLDSMLSTLHHYRGLPHRSQWIAEINSVTWINDSKATNVGATLAALGGINEPIVLIAGGQAKGADLTPLRAAMENVRAVVLIGEDADQLEMVLAGTAEIVSANSMKQAVEKAAGLAQPGDVVLFAPACASFDMFANYSARGDAFIGQVFSLQRGGSGS